MKDKCIIDKCIIVDIDGTIALDKHGEIIPTDFTREGWNDFHKHMDMYNADRFIPIWSTIDMIKCIVNDSLGTIAIFFVTAREDTGKGKIRDNTLELLTNYFPYVVDEQLYMRAENDFRSSAEVKRDILLHDILPKYNVLFAVDDEEDNIKMFQTLGITAYKVYLGDRVNDCE